MLILQSAYRCWSSSDRSLDFLSITRKAPTKPHRACIDGYPAEDRTLALRREVRGLFQNPPAAPPRAQHSVDDGRVRFWKDDNVSTRVFAHLSRVMSARQPFYVTMGAKHFSTAS